MSKNIVCFGEVLWDIFPDHKVVGGAPLNVALRLHSLGNQVQMISRIGCDPLGDGILDYLRGAKFPTNFIQKDPVYGSGEVTVMLNDKGSASYDIVFPKAWDHIDVSGKDLELVASSDVFIYGSLAARSQESRESLFLLLQEAPFTVFDVNLRTPYYTLETLVALMEKANFMKFNDEELFEVAGGLGCDSSSLEQNMMFISEKFGCTQLCVTKGKHGAILLYGGEWHYSSGFHIQVVDTVGAGDSFLATLITYLSSHSPKEALDYACAMGALVASSKGPNPEISSATLENMIGKAKHAT